MLLRQMVVTQGITGGIIMTDQEIIQKACDIAERQSKLIELAFVTLDIKILKAIQKKHDSLSKELKELRKYQKVNR